MDENARVSFSIQPFEEMFAVTPVVNGTPRGEMALTFKREQHFEPTGGYGGLIPQWFKYGALDTISWVSLNRTAISPAWVGSIY
jgi:hypothetical protein